MSVLLLQIRFAIKVLGLHETDALRQRAMHQDQVAWEVLSLAHLHKTADLNSLTYAGLQLV